MPAKSTHVKVICQCGATFRAKREHAGKRTRCPSCRSVLVVPRTKSGNPSTKQAGGNCPQCSASMEPNSILCIQCGYHRGEGKQLAAKVGRTRRIDEQVKLRQQSDQLLFTLNWRGTSGILGMNEIVLLGVVWLIGAVVASPIISQIVGENQLAGFSSLLGLLLPALYFILAKNLNQTDVTVTRESLRVRHRPIPWKLPLTIPRDRLTQIFVRRKKWSEGGGQGSASVEIEAYDVCALTTKGGRYRLLRTRDLDSALRVEEIIEEFLGIEDEEVAKFTAPRFQVVIKGGCIIAAGLFLMSLAPANANFKFDPDRESGILFGLVGLAVAGYGAWRVYFALTEDRDLVEEDLQG